MKKTLISLGLALAANSVNAGVITYENRTTNAGVDKTNYEQSWNNQGTPITSRTLDEFSHVRTNHTWHQHSHLNINFDVADSSSGMDWWFQFSPDAGHGGEVYFDGLLVDRDTSNLWWGGNWNNSGELLTAYINDLGAGSHSLDLYWAENCCNGGQSGRFSVDNGANWYALTTDNLDAVGVSEPGSLALFGLGLLGLVATRRRKQV